MRKLFLLLFTLVLIGVTSCDKDEATSTDLSNYVGFEQGDINFAVEKDGTSTRDIIVAASEITGSDRTFSIMVIEEETTLSESYFTLANTVTIPANSNIGYLSLSVTDDDNLSFEPKTIAIAFVHEEGMFFSEQVIVNITEECLNTQVKLSLVFDTYPDEAYWELYDLSGSPTIIQSGGEGSAYAGLEDFSIDFCLASGEYGIIVYDTYGDGGTEYTVSLSDDTILATGTTPDAGGGYPVLTNSSSVFTIE